MEIDVDASDWSIVFHLERSECSNGNGITDTLNMVNEKMYTYLFIDRLQNFDWIVWITLPFHAVQSRRV